MEATTNWQDMSGLFEEFTNSKLIIRYCIWKDGFVELMVRDMERRAKIAVWGEGYIKSPLEVQQMLNACYNDTYDIKSQKQMELFVNELFKKFSRAA